MTDANNNQQKFVQSLRGHIEKAIENNPSLLRRRHLNQAVVAEIRRRLKEGVLAHPLAAVADESGKVTFIETKEKTTADELIQKLREAARDAKILSTSLGTIVEQSSPTGGKAALYIKLHTEDRNGTAIVGLIPTNENEHTVGVAGVKGPAVAVMGKKVAPIIFVAA